MKKIVILLLISLFLLGCNLPFSITWKTTPAPADETLPPTEESSQAATEAQTVVPTEAPTESQTVVPTEAPSEAPVNGTEYNLSGVQMVLPPCMAASATSSIIQAVPYDENNGPMEYYPENRKITFQGYPLSDKFFRVDDPAELGGVMVYPVMDFVVMNQFIADRVTAMQNLLATTPPTPDSIPLLPILSAAQIFRAQIKYLTFQNGQGIRFLTKYGQGFDPVNNHDLFYAFQGITADGKYWISAILPVNAAYLQATWESTIVPAGGIAAPNMDDPNYSADMMAYYSNMIIKLNTTADAEFTPGLDCLDQFIQSLQIGD